MAYRIDPARPADAELRRIVLEEIDAALRALGDPERDGLEETVHGVRKRCKKLRALIRLTRRTLGAEYRSGNAAVREASALLSPLRDAHAVLRTFDALRTARAELVPVRGLQDVRAGLAIRAARAEVGGVGERLEGAAALLAGVRHRVPDWRLGDLRVVLAGAADYHGRAREAFRRSLDDSSDEALHEWRKRVKDGWHHTQLLRELAPSTLVPQERALHDLSDALGDNNDLAVLGVALRDAPDELGGTQAHEALLICEAVRDDLVARARGLGARVHAEDARAYRRRLRRYATAHRRFGPERAVGEIGAIDAAGSPVS